MTVVPDYVSPPAPRGRFAMWPAVLAWVVIVGSVGLIAGSVGLRNRAAVTPGGPVDPAGQATNDVLMQSRIAVGLHRMMRGFGAGGAPLTQALEQTATTPLGRLRTIPAIAEVEGAAAAVSRLDALRQNGSFPEDLRPDADAFHTIYAESPAALSDDRRAWLMARHGWFARASLSFGLPDDDPARRQALWPATRAAVTVVIAFGLGGVACLAGVGLLIWALVLVADRRLRRAYVPPPPGRSGPFVEAFAIYLLGMILVSLAVDWLLPNATFAASWLMIVPLPLAIVWPRLRGMPWAEVRAGFGWHRGRGWLREAAFGVAGYVAGLPLVVAAALVTSLLVRATGVTPSHPIQDEIGAGGPLHTLQLYVLAAAYAPLVEETFFRGAFYHHLRRRLPWWLAGLAVAIVFAAIHPQGWVGIPLLATIALVFAALREWRGSIIAPVVCHACVNAVSLTVLVLATS